jgi:hypothetical protein
MSIQIIGYSGTIADSDGSVYQALKVTPRPVEYGLHGTYRLSVATGTFSSATLSNGSVFQFYWPSSTLSALIWGMLVDFSGSSSSGGVNQFKLSIARQVTANGSGGTTVTIPGTSGASQQLRTSMKPALASPILIATTAALTNGTWTLDSTPIASATFAVDTSGTNKNFLSRFQLYGNLAHRTGAPLILGQSEALNLSLSTPSGPTFEVGVTMAWTEAAYY